jgi:glutathione S-transferase
MPQSDLPIVLYHYAYSPFARRVVWYLHLRGIPYSQCAGFPNTNHSTTS